MKNLVVFASGSGSNFQSIIDAVTNGNLNARITGLIANKYNIGAITKAEANDIPVRVLSDIDFDLYSDYENVLLTQLRSWKADIVILAGYLRKIPGAVISEYEGKILNIHPSLLPKYGGKGFYGIKVHKAVIEAGDTESGCTIHIVSEEYDKGPILAQQKVSVLPNDTPEDLAARVLVQEHLLYPKIIANYINTLTN